MCSFFKMFSEVCWTFRLSPTGQCKSKTESLLRDQSCRGVTVQPGAPARPMKPLVPFFLLSSCPSPTGLRRGRDGGDDGGGAGAVRAVAGAPPLHRRGQQRPWIELGFGVSGVWFIAGGLEEVRGGGGTGGGLVVRRGGDGAASAMSGAWAVGGAGGGEGALTKEEAVKRGCCMEEDDDQRSSRQKDNRSVELA
jgi:hypothetical protein